MYDYKMLNNFLPQKKWDLKSPYSMKPEGICIHNTSNDASAQNEASYMINNTSSTSFHVAIDDIAAIQCIPFDRNAFHAGDGSNGTGNRKYISIEICYSMSGGIKFAKAEGNAVDYVAKLLISYGFGIDRVKAHKDFSGKNCPHRTDMSAFKKAVEIRVQELKRMNVINKYVIYFNNTKQEVINNPDGSLAHTMFLCLKAYGYDVELRPLNIPIENNKEQGVFYYGIGGSINGNVNVDKLLSGNDRYNTAKVVLNEIKELCK